MARCLKVVNSEADLSKEGKDPPMNCMKRLIMIALLLLIMAALTYSQTPVKLNGSEGIALLQRMTKSHLNLNNTSLNATNSSANLIMPRNTSGNLDSWGGKPKNPPLPGSQPGDDYLNDPILGDMQI